MKSVVTPIRSVDLIARGCVVCFVVKLLVLIAAGCTNETPAKKTAAVDAAESKPIAVTAERGPVLMTVTASNDSISVGQKLDLTIEVVADDNVRVQMPVIEQTLGAFSVRQRSTPPDVPEQGKRRWKHTYKIDTFATGDVEIPALEVNYTDRRQATIDEQGDAIEAMIATEPIRIQVQSVLAADAVETDFRDIRGTVNVPVPREFDRRPIVMALVLALLVLVGTAAALVLWRLLRPKGGNREKLIPIVPAHVRALQALDELAAKKLIEEQRFHDYYYALGNIVRLYVEDRFALMAPERTTDEFLREAQRDRRLTEAHRELLKQFLRTADMVKFALFTPAAGDAISALDAAREFVLETQESEGAIGDGGATNQMRREPAGVGA